MSTFAACSPDTCLTRAEVRRQEVKITRLEGKVRSLAKISATLNDGLEALLKISGELKKKVDERMKCVDVLEERLGRLEGHRRGTTVDTPVALEMTLAAVCGETEGGCKFSVEAELRSGVCINTRRRHIENDP